MSGQQYNIKTILVVEKELNFSKKKNKKLILIKVSKTSLLQNKQ